MNRILILFELRVHESSEVLGNQSFSRNALHHRLSNGLRLKCWKSDSCSVLGSLYFLQLTQETHEPWGCTVSEFSSSNYRIQDSFTAQGHVYIKI
jgi:hypothetical protein